MRVELDTDLCQGHAMCVLEAPTVFELPKGAFTVTIIDAEPDEALRTAVTTAAKFCPTMALTIIDDTTS